MPLEGLSAGKGIQLITVSEVSRPDEEGRREGDIIIEALVRTTVAASQTMRLTTLPPRVH